MWENVKPGETVGLSGIPGVLELFAINGDAAEATIDFTCGTNSTKGIFFDDRCEGRVFVVVRGNLVGRNGCPLPSAQMMIDMRKKKKKHAAEERKKRRRKKKAQQQQREE